MVSVESLDPADALTPRDWELLQAMGEGLLRQEPGNGEIVPGIAEDMPEVSDDGLTYTLRIRSDVEFADGLQLTAPLYVESIDRVVDLGGRNSDLVSLFVSNVEAVDEQTVEFRLNDSYAFFPTLLAASTYLPSHPEIFPRDQLVPRPQAPIYGVGPFFVESITESEIVLEANPGYFGERGQAGRVVLQVFETVDEMANALREGAIDMAWRGLDSETAASLGDAEDVTVETVSGGTSHFLITNHALSPTDDPLVRRAIAELLDRQTIVDNVLGGAFVPSFSPVPRGYGGSSDSFKELYGEPDVAAAIELLTEAGYSESSPAEIELAYPPEQFGLHISAAMEEIELQMESTGLINVTLTAQPWATYVGDVVGGTYNLAFLGWFHDYPDPHNYLAPFILNGGLGGSGENLQSGEIVDMVTEAALERDSERRTELYEEIQTLFAEDVITIPLWVEHPHIAYRDTVAGSPGFENAQSLNVGISLQLDFRALQLRPGEGS